MGGFELGDRDLEVRRKREQVRTLSTRDVSDLIVSLDADDSKRRASAAWSLAEVAATTPKRVPVPDLTQAITDDDRWVRRGATWALAEVAQRNPTRARPAVERAIGLVNDGDPLVRENAVVTVAGVAAEFPKDVEPAITALVELRNDANGALRRYATDALQHVVNALSQAQLDGEPVVISVNDPTLARHLPDGANVIQTDMATDPGAIRIAPGSTVEDETGVESQSRRAETPRIGDKPPSEEEMASPPQLSVEYGDFEKLSFIGKSPLLTVHRARASTPNEQHAVAMLFTLRTDFHDETVSPSLAQAFDRWQAIDDHDHILSVRAHGESPRTWAATEFTDGGALADSFDADLDASLWFAYGLVRAVSHAHALGVVHGGLCSPAVRFSTSFGSTWPVPKIGDWGLARVAMDERQSAGGYGQNQRPPIPPAYAAPEHLDPESFGAIDHSTDVYGLGTLLYGLLAGQPPFLGDPHVVAGQVMTDDPPIPSEQNPNLPEEVDTVLSRSLAKRKQARYETVDDLLVALEQCISVISN